MRGKALAILLATALPAFLLFHSGVAAQTYKRLPRAGFQTSTTLPKVNGLHLDDAQQERGPAKGPSGPGEPYNPGEQMVNWGLVRWEPKKMPLLVWISPGLKLPDIPFSQIQSARVDMVTQMLQSATQPDPFVGLTQAPGWTPETNDQVAAGIEQWREFEKEGLFRFLFTDNPRDAHIMVFFTDSFKESDAPGGISVGGITSAQIYSAAQAQQMKIRQKPVIIELSTMVDCTAQKMQGASAHEFGHALGIKAHSPYREDIMNVDRVVDYLSPSDKATIRYLYHKPLQWVL